MVALGSSTTEGLATSNPDSSWVRRFNAYYKNQLGIVDTTYNLSVSATNLYHAMPTNYVPPPSRPNPNPLNNVTRANTLLSGLVTPANGVVIINFPSGGYDTYTITEIMIALQIMYDSARRTGNRAYVTTTQPRTDAGFNTSAVKRKLADIKDSIVNRFGVANTINFYDGMYNPADSTILSAYSSGDNVHFNNAGHRILFERVRAKNVFNLPQPNYRSNVVTTGLWENASSWQTYNGTSWVAAEFPPSMGSGSITILAEDSIRVNNFMEADQLVIEQGGVLAIFNNLSNTKAIFTVNDGSGTDVINNGRLYISANGVLNGNGSLENSSTGLFTLRNRGVLNINTINAGVMWVNNTGIVRNRSLTNNKTFVLQDFTLNLIRSTFINNDSLSILGSGITFIADSTLQGGSFTNTAAGIVQRQSATGITNFNPSVNTINNGRIKGLGEYAFYNMTANTGRIEPGFSPGRLTINPSSVNNLSPLFDIEISTTGAVKGANYDHVVLSTLAPATKNISNARLRVTDNAADPVGTVYTIITPASGLITGNFANVILSPTLSGPNYHGGDSISVVKVIPLPLTWGSFDVVSSGTRAKLKWTTLQEMNTHSFEIEHSVDGITYSQIGRLSAAGNSSVELAYYFEHASPDLSSINYYRIRQTDIDGNFSYSIVRQLSFSNSNSLYVRGIATSVTGSLNVQVLKNGVRIDIYDMNGKSISKKNFNAGTHEIHFSGLATGHYLIVVYYKKQQVEVYRVLKNKHN